jgi:hypothetical protein
MKQIPAAPAPKSARDSIKPLAAGLFGAVRDDLTRLAVAYANSTTARAINQLLI